LLLPPRFAEKKKESGRQNADPRFVPRGPACPEIAERETHPGLRQKPSIGDTEKELETERERERERERQRDRERETERHRERERERERERPTSVIMSLH